MKLEDLVVLQYASNTCYTTVVRVGEIKEESFSVDLEKSTWSFREYKDRKIGDSRYCPTDRQGGVIGVYDRTNDDHLRLMLHAAQEAVDLHQGGDE